jgi:PKD repeat protein
MWTWVSGSNTGGAASVYGTKGVSAPTNVPGARQGSHAYKDAAGNLWLLGGYDQTGAMINDLWRYVPDAACGGCSGPPVINFTASDRHICPGECISFTNFTSGATSYQWSFPGASPSTSTDANPTFICYNTPGLYSVTLIASNSLYSDTITLNNLIQVYPQPILPVITQIGDTLFSSGGYATYQWFDVSDTIPGATNYFYVATHSGNYNLVVTDDNGCAVGVGILNVIAGVKEFTVDGLQLTVYPNPNDGSFSIALSGKEKMNAVVQLIDDIGQIVFEKNVLVNVGENKIDIGTGNISKGIYLLQIKSGKEIVSRKMVVVR